MPRRRHRGPRRPILSREEREEQESLVRRNPMPKPETMAQKHKKAGLSREQALETEVARLRLIFNKIKKRRPPLSEKTIFRIAKDNVESAYDT